MQGNNYWEEQRKQYYSQIEENILHKKIKQCQLVLDKLEKDELWHIIIENADEWITQVDKHWQEVYDEEKLKPMRVVKLAANHLKSLKDAYIAEWKLAQEELLKRKDPNIVEKDYDGN
jgi:DNA replicative helicase MCM subunit Mcm2 (Cdc46/Mcm family)